MHTTETSRAYLAGMSARSKGGGGPASSDIPGSGTRGEASEPIGSQLFSSRLARSHPLSLSNSPPAGSTTQLWIVVRSWIVLNLYQHFSPAKPSGKRKCLSKMVCRQRRKASLKGHRGICACLKGAEMAHFVGKQLRSAQTSRTNVALGAWERMAMSPHKSLILSHANHHWPARRIRCYNDACSGFSFVDSALTYQHSISQRSKRPRFETSFLLPNLHF